MRRAPRGHAQDAVRVRSSRPQRSIRPCAGVTAYTLEAVDFSSAVTLEPGLEGIDLEANPDPEGDGIGVLLEYAFGGSFLDRDDPDSLLPQVDYDELGFMIRRNPGTEECDEYPN